MVEAQIRTAEKFGFDYVNGISDPRARRRIAARRSVFDNQPGP